MHSVCNLTNALTILNGHELETLESHYSFRFKNLLDNQNRFRQHQMQCGTRVTP